MTTTETETAYRFDIVFTDRVMHMVDTNKKVGIDMVWSYERDGLDDTIDHVTMYGYDAGHLIYLNRWDNLR